ncbi:sensor histidine kinase [Pontivivens insulae]|uniref:histidine kinase n=1 Tax=Pontivivens insulae TaxID=1639689 RepID=A0A2R8ACW7_9RHOB|nr:sensor histidine kinase [Pontivivens insulae]RED14013.1 Na+/proline symporter [Pontivivens insulae]SPF30087.1 Sensor protein kinase WalK [Pontivivens insulae]
MLSWNVIVLTCLLYVAALFGVAFWAERRARAGHFGWMRSPLVYTLSISVYCTAWTYYGAVGSAARNGLEFAAIYLGPTLVFIGWWFLFRKLVRIAREQRTTSIADLLSSRYGKSSLIGVFVTVLAVIASTPYIALQLTSLSLSFTLFSDGSANSSLTAFWIAVGLAIFTILFGTRHVDANERHYGVVTAIALEAIVKLVAIASVGLFVVFGLASGPSDIFARPESAELLSADIFGPRWITLVFLSATAIICLPRMFQVIVVENVDERHLATAAWAFPMYIFLMSLFVLPIAIVGLNTMPAGSNPDLFVLTLPLASGANTLALVAFIGGFSAATSMVIVSAIALATMMSNHIFMPLWLRATAGTPSSSGDVRRILLISRRVSILVIMGLGYLYYLLAGDGGALASIGLIAFLGAAQFLPSVIAGLYWRGATRTGALLAVGSGAVVWAYTLFLPSFGGSLILSAETIANGPFGLGWLRPNALFGSAISDPLVHAVIWSMAVNITMLCVGSMMSRPRALEQLQAKIFVDVFALSAAGQGMSLGRTAKSEKLFELAQRILGREQAGRMFTEIARAQGKPSGLPDADPALTARLERALAGALGASSAHAMVSQISGHGTVSVPELIRMADETAQIVEYSHRIEEKSRELEISADQLRRANERLRAISDQKDAFLSQVSHELRTPMTSIRSFAEILRETDQIDPDQHQRFVTIIHEESQRLTRLLDEILDLSVLETGRTTMRRDPLWLDDVIRQALDATEPLMRRAGVQPDYAPGAEIPVLADRDRLAQVFINVLSNAVKYGLGLPPRIKVEAVQGPQEVTVTITDNGPGIAEADADRVFEKFSRLGEATLAGSAGLGLPISREIMRNLDGDLTLRSGEGGACFVITLPVVEQSAAAE